MPDRVRLSIVITGLGIGGAEHALQRLLSRFDRDRFDISLVVLGRDVTLAPRFREIGIEPIVVGLGSGRWPLREVRRLVDAVRTTRPDIVQGWMYHGNLAASFAGRRLANKVPVCWSIRDTPDAANDHSRFTSLVIRVSTWFVPGVERIFNVSARSAAYCVAHLGWPSDRMEVLPNGIDTHRFRPDRAGREAIRTSLGVGPTQPLIGMMARWSPVKNHGLFLQAAAVLRRVRPDARFVLAGKGLDASNAELMSEVRNLELTDVLHLLGPRHDAEKIDAALDVATLTSRSEGFPNVLAEAMSCGVPVVSTDVGDAVDIVGDGGRIVEAAAEAFAGAWLEMIDESTNRRVGDLARRRIEDRYDLDLMAERLQHTYRALAHSGAPHFRAVEVPSR